MNKSDLVGKTILNVDLGDIDYKGRSELIVITFTDGSTIEFRPGWDLNSRDFWVETDIQDK